MNSCVEWPFSFGLVYLDLSKFETEILTGQLEFTTTRIDTTASVHNTQSIHGVSRSEPAAAAAVGNAVSLTCDDKSFRLMRADSPFQF